MPAGEKRVFRKRTIEERVFHFEIEHFFLIYVDRTEIIIIGTR